MNPPLFSHELRWRFSEFVTLRLGLRFAPDRWDELERGAVAAALELGFVDAIEWTERLMTGVSTFTQLQTLANQLTVGETYFFRQTEVFTALQEKVLPELIQARRAKRELRIWSAGCSTGEEPYSLAILLHQLLPDLAGWRIVVAATDVSTHALSKAAVGRYSEWSFRQTPGWVKQNYFTSVGARHYQILPKIREAVRFSYLNLVESSYPSFLGGALSFDLIVCRNVLMYFSPEWQHDILRRLGGQLAGDGYLLLGPCDVPSGLGEGFAQAAAGYGFYQKNHGPKPVLWLPPLAEIRGLEPLMPDDRTTNEFGVRSRSDGPAESAPDGLIAIPLPEESGRADSLEIERGSAADPLLAAQTQGDQGNLAAALALCSEAVEADKLNARARYLRGCVWQELGEALKAAGEFRATLYLAPDHVMAHLALASQARESQRWGLARRHYRQADRVLSALNRGEILAGSEGLTVARMRELIAEFIATAHE